MKKIILAASIFMVATAITNKATAQIRAKVNVNISSQPVWGPTGYDHADYYYLPDVEAYYDVTHRQFIYQNGKRWVFAASLPSKYKSFDLNTGYKVVENEPKPYMHFDQDREKYKNFRGNHSQEVIRNSNDSKYFVVKGHPKYGQRNNKDDKRGHH